nr:homeobox protein pknox1 [Quercus suber]
MDDSRQRSNLSLPLFLSRLLDGSEIRAVAYSWDYYYPLTPFRFLFLPILVAPFYQPPCARLFLWQEDWTNSKPRCLSSMRKRRNPPTPQMSRNCWTYPSPLSWIGPLHPTLPEGWDLSASQIIDTGTGLEEPDYSKFENWIPRFIRPGKPCDYCRSKRLDCYLQRGEVSCAPCRTLFRECSLNNSHTLESMNYNNSTTTGMFLDTLHIVDEETAKERGTLTGIKPMNFRTRPSGTTTPVLDDEPGSSKRNGIRFPRHAVKTLRDWLDAHSDHPYPTEDEKAALEKQTELKPSQIANWLANARRRRKVTEKKPKIPMSPSLKPTTPAIEIPNVGKPWEELNPFERWKNSPPENEPASITDIAQALANSDIPEELASASPDSSVGVRKRSSNGSGFASHRAPSTTSLDTSAQTSSLSASSAVFSHGSSHSHGSFGSFHSSLTGKKDRRRRKRPMQTTVRKPSEEKQRIFQCTFCTDTFKSKYDWTRHEKSLHLSLEKWICAPLGPITTDLTSGKKICAYCEVQEPSADHIETHNHRQCEEKGLDARTFYRKDHLRQHMRLMHGCEMSAAMDHWKSVAVNVNSRCGFCSQRFSTWQERVDHLTAHFKTGSRMSQWRGCRGLDPAVTAQVTNAMPPYLIGLESVSPNPFSATNRSTWRQAHELVDNPEDLPFEVLGSQEPVTKSTCWEILTVRLGKYANQMIQKGVILTDDMLQQEARSILFGSDDSWNQTAADNPEWLDLFKKAHGLDFIPNSIGGEGQSVPGDLETYGDLGLRIPFAVQLRALNSQQDMSVTSGCPQPLKDEVHTRIATLKTAHSVLNDKGLLHDENFRCGHTECDNNQVETTYNTSPPAGPRFMRWCSHTLTPDLIAHAASLRRASLQPSSDSSASMAHQEGTVETTSRVEGLATLERMENATLGLPAAAPSSKKPCVPRHRYELSEDRARRFATTTGAWTDSGIMPPPITTATTNTTDPLFMPPGLGLAPTTGAMMEFLGNRLGSALPFSRDTTSSIINPPASDPEWQFNDELTMQDLDDLIAATTAESGLVAPAPACASDLMSGDISLDTDSWFDTGIHDIDTLMHDSSATPTAASLLAGDVGNSVGATETETDIFDGVFDMPLDETFEFHPQSA